VQVDISDFNIISTQPSVYKQFGPEGQNVGEHSAKQGQFPLLESPIRRQTTQHSRRRITLLLVMAWPTAFSQPEICDA